ncbi:MAG TPA: hypothetical protein VMV79_06125, partial [Alphaproteobacteria bacterium]|nr:hypothetical protein [Alphaproteobacteria bacterium]
MRFLPLVLLLAILLAPLAAAADDAITHAGWDLRPVFGHGGDFAYCLIDRADTGGKKLTVALDPQNEINLGFTIPGAGLKPGARYDMVVAFAGGWKRTVRGAALDPDTILLQLGAEPGWPQALMANVGLTLQGIKGGPQVPFALPLMKSAFDALRGCIARNKGRIDKKAAT